MTEDKKRYEIGCLFNYKLTEDELAREVVKLIEIIKQEEGEILLEGPAAKRRLAYPIKKETEAYFGWIEFLMLPEKIADFKKTLRLNQRIIRFLILNKKRKGVRLRKIRGEKNLESPQLSKTQLENDDFEKKLNELMVAVNPHTR